MSGRGLYVPEFIRRTSIVLDAIDSLVARSPWKLTDKAKFEVDEIKKGVRWLRDEIDRLREQVRKADECRCCHCRCCNGVGTNDNLARSASVERG